MRGSYWYIRDVNYPILGKIGKLTFKPKCIGLHSFGVHGKHQPADPGDFVCLSFQLYLAPLSLGVI